MTDERTSVATTDEETAEDTTRDPETTDASKRDREAALAELDDPDADQRAEVGALAARLVEGLLAPPTAALAAGDDETGETAMALFGRDDADGDLEPADTDGETAAANAVD